LTWNGLTNNANDCENKIVFAIRDNYRKSEILFSSIENVLEYFLNERHYTILFICAIYLSVYSLGISASAS